MSRVFSGDRSGSTALVTGGSYCIGEELANHFADAGVTVVGVATSEDGLQATIDPLESAYVVEGRPTPADLREEPQIAAALADAIDAFGLPDILVNNAGGYPSAPPWRWTRRTPTTCSTSPTGR